LVKEHVNGLTETFDQNDCPSRASLKPVELTRKIYYHRSASTINNPVKRKKIVTVQIKDAFCAILSKVQFFAAKVRFNTELTRLANSWY